MEAKELRIGNFVALDDEYQRKTMSFTGGVINGIQKKHVVYNEINNVPVKNLKPIPLTEGWLLKFGFKQYDFVVRPSNTWLLSGFAVEFYKDRFIFRYEDYLIGTPILYVHQLQNFHFAITGKELTIKQTTFSSS